MAPTTRFRPFTLLDALILIGATATGFGLTRSFSDIQAIISSDMVSFWDRPGTASGRSADNALYDVDGYYTVRSRSWPGYLAYWTQRAALWPCPCLVSWTVAAGVLALLPPRPRWPRQFRRPGVLASMTFIMGLAVLASVFPQSLIAWRTAVPGQTFYWRDWWVETCFFLPRAAALVVSVSWLTLALSGRWRPDRGWLDRLGRILGTCWICLGVVRVVSSWLVVFAS